MYLKLRAKLPFNVFNFYFGTFPQKVAQTWFVSQDTRHTILFGINYCVEIVGIEKSSHMFEITC